MSSAVRSVAAWRNWTHWSAITARPVGRRSGSRLSGRVHVPSRSSARWRAAAARRSSRRSSAGRPPGATTASSHVPSHGPLGDVGGTGRVVDAVAPLEQRAGQRVGAVVRRELAAGDHPPQARAGAAPDEMPNSAAVVTRAATGRVGSVAPSSAEASTDRAVERARRFDQIADGRAAGLEGPRRHGRSVADRPDVTQPLTSVSDCVMLGVMGTNATRAAVDERCGHRPTGAGAHRRRHHRRGRGLAGAGRPLPRPGALRRRAGGAAVAAERVRAVGGRRRTRRSRRAHRVRRAAVRDPRPRRSGAGVPQRLPAPRRPARRRRRLRRGRWCARTTAGRTGSTVRWPTCPHAEAFPDVDAATHGPRRGRQPRASTASSSSARSTHRPTDLDPLIGGRPWRDVLLDPTMRMPWRRGAKAMNWKVLVEQFLEGYHIRTTHRDTFFPLQYDDLNVVEPFGRNVRVTYPYRNIERLRDRAEADWSVRERVTFVYHLFPNVMVATFPDQVTVIVIDPIDVGTRSSRRTRCPAAGRRRLALRTAARPRTMTTATNAPLLVRGALEDDAMSRGVQAGLDQPAPTPSSSSAATRAPSGTSTASSPTSSPTAGREGDRSPALRGRPAAIATITLNRPASFNALRPEMIAGLDAALRARQPRRRRQGHRPAGRRRSLLRRVRLLRRPRPRRDVPRGRLRPGHRRVQDHQLLHQRDRHLHGPLAGPQADHRQGPGLLPRRRLRARPQRRPRRRRRRRPLRHPLLTGVGLPPRPACGSIGSASPRPSTTPSPASGSAAAMPSTAELINASHPRDELDDTGRLAGHPAHVDPAHPAHRHEADRQPGLRQHGPAEHPDARADPRRRDAQHPRRPRLRPHRSRPRRPPRRRPARRARGATTARPHPTNDRPSWPTDQACAGGVAPTAAGRASTAGRRRSRGPSRSPARTGRRSAPSRAAALAALAGW